VVWFNQKKKPAREQCRWGRCQIDETKGSGLIQEANVLENKQEGRERSIYEQETGYEKIHQSVRNAAEERVPGAMAQDLAELVAA